MKKVDLCFKMACCAVLLMLGLSGLHAQKMESGKYFAGNPTGNCISKYKAYKIQSLQADVYDSEGVVNLTIIKQLDVNPLNKKNEKQKYNRIYKEIPNYYYNKKCGQYTDHVANAFCHFIVDENGDLIAYSLDDNKQITCIDLFSTNRRHLKSIDNAALKSKIEEVHKQIEQLLVKQNQVEEKLYDLPAPKMVDSKLEAKILKTIQEHAKSQGWDENFVKAIISENEWEIRRNALTGVVTDRIITAACVAKWPDGHCSYQYFYFRQDFDGTGYQENLKYHAAGQQYHTPCD